MKYKVLVDERFFEVEIIDLSARPILARIESEVFEVWPENEGTAPSKGFPALQAALPRQPLAPVDSGRGKYETPAGGSPATQSGDGNSLKMVRAPIPGVIVSIAVQPGSDVTTGQELCVLEAMKMKNSVRATRAGEIAKINIAVGQHVKHHDVLVEYAE